jgi:hypothetical protein
LHRCVDLADIAQHARPECDLVERHAVAPQGGLGLGAADDVVPGILVEVGPRLGHQFVEILEIAGGGAHLDGFRRRIVDPVVHFLVLRFV